MYLGKIMEIGPAERVIRSPRNPYTQALVSVSPSPEPPTPGQRARRTILVGETPDAAHIPTGCRFHPRCPLAFDRCAVEEPPLFDVGRRPGGGVLAGGARTSPAGDRDGGSHGRGDRAGRGGMTVRQLLEVTQRRVWDQMGNARRFSVENL